MATPSLSQYHITQLFRASVRGTPFTPAAALYMSMHITTPGPLNDGTEVSAGVGYARKIITFDDIDFTLVSKGKTVNSALIPNFGASTGSWNPGGGGAIGFFGLYDSLGIGTGNLLWYGPLDAVQTVNGPGLSTSVLAGTIELLMG